MPLLKGQTNGWMNSHRTEQYTTTSADLKLTAEEKKQKTKTVPIVIIAHPQSTPMITYTVYYMAFSRILPLRARNVFEKFLRKIKLQENN